MSLQGRPTPRTLRSARRHRRSLAGKEVPGIGIYHEAYCVQAGRYEAIYRNMPRSGLAKIGRIISVSGACGHAPAFLRRRLTGRPCLLRAAVLLPRSPSC